MTTICHHNHVAALFKQFKKHTHTFTNTMINDQKTQIQWEREKNRDSSDERESFNKSNNRIYFFKNHIRVK